MYFRKELTALYRSVLRTLVAKQSTGNLVKPSYKDSVCLGKIKKSDGGRESGKSVRPMRRKAGEISISVYFCSRSSLL